MDKIGARQEPRPPAERHKLRANRLFTRYFLTAMYLPVATNDPKAVETEVNATYLALYPDEDGSFVKRAFEWVLECFTGRREGYQAVDARYHDLEHTMQGTLCMTRLLRGRAAVGVEPRSSAREFCLGILAILLHDTGYLKRQEDRAGTGAKYTITHVARSVEFAGQLLTEKSYSKQDIQAVQNMIRCTGLNANLSTIPFNSQIERITGYALATSDLLGQMAAADYVEKLPVLYSEFAEASAFSGDRTHFISAFASSKDLTEKTPAFWERSIRPKLDGELLGLWRFLSQPHPDGPNEYIDRIEANMERIRRRSADPQMVG